MQYQNISRHESSDNNNVSCTTYGGMDWMVLNNSYVASDVARTHARSDAHYNITQSIYTDGFDMISNDTIRLNDDR